MKSRKLWIPFVAACMLVVVAVAGMIVHSRRHAWCRKRCINNMRMLAAGAGSFCLEQGKDSDFFITVDILDDRNVGYINKYLRCPLDGAEYPSFTILEGPMCPNHGCLNDLTCCWEPWSGSREEFIRALCRGPEFVGMSASYPGMEGLTSELFDDDVVRFHYLNVMRDGDSGTRMVGVLKLGALGNTRAIGALKECAEQDESWIIRVRATEQLSNFDDIRAMEALESLSRDSDKRVMEAAQESLRKLGKHK